jgi:cysteine desulfurase/selenocysteine lyase
MIDVNKIRGDFKVYESHPNLIYLDSSASALKVKDAVLAMDHYHNDLGSNVHRGSYDLSYEATRLYEEARDKIARFINAENTEVVFTKGATAALNIVAHGYLTKLSKGDEIIVTALEHHSSLLPWMHVAKMTGAVLKYIPLKNNRITVEGLKEVISNKTKVVAVTYVSNTLGYITPIKEITKVAHEHQAIVVCDAAQAAPHIKIDVKDIDVDYLAFSGHKMYGPSGVGVLFGKKHLLDTLNPLEFGGEMADVVDYYDATFKEAPLKFEAGTPVIGAAIGLGAAVDYINKIGLDNIHNYSLYLKEYTLKKIINEPGIEIYNTDADVGIILLNVTDVHPHDIATVLNQDEVSVRAGKHCAHLVSKQLGVDSTVRASFNIYNTEKDCDVFVESLLKARDFFGSF